MLKYKILWASNTDPNKLVRPDGSSLTYLEAVSLFGTRNPEVSRTTNYKEFKDALEINKDSFFTEVCIDYNIDNSHTGVDCMKLLIKYCLDNNLKVPKISPINADSDQRIEILSVIEESYKHIVDEENYM